MKNFAVVGLLDLFYETVCVTLTFHVITRFMLTFVGVFTIDSWESIPFQDPKNQETDNNRV